VSIEQSIPPTSTLIHVKESWPWPSAVKPLDETKTFGFQSDTCRRSWKAMTDFLATALS
jgi:hypothetical protein